VVDAVSKRGTGCFLLNRDEEGRLSWRKVPVQADTLINVDKVFATDDSAIALFCSKEATYYSRSSEISSRDFLRAVLTAPWNFRDISNAKLVVGVRNSKTGGYEDIVVSVDRYDLAGRWGRLLKNMADGAYRSAVVIALVDAFLWLRSFSLSPHAFGVSPLYLVIGLGVGALLYSLGWLFEYLFERFYGTTPAAEIVDAEATA
jgi:hypothetical protein